MLDRDGHHGPERTGRRACHSAGRLSVPEVMSIMILFHNSGYRSRKHFCQKESCVKLLHLFPQVVSKSRFMEQEKGAAIPLGVFTRKVLMGKCTGIIFVDSTPLRVCRNQRIHIQKTSKGFAARGKCSVGCLLVLSLHLICSEKGEVLHFMVAPGEEDERKPLENRRFIEMIFDKLVADKGYISKALFQKLFVNGMQLITKQKSNMKGAPMSASGRVLLPKRSIIETINDELKKNAGVERSRHRIVRNLAVNLLGTIAAYRYFPKKPAMQVARVYDNQLTLS